MLDETGSAATTTQGAEDATQYAVNQLNAKGGIDGHKIKFQYCDSQSTTQGGATCGAQLAGVNSHIVILLSANPAAQGAETQLTSTVGLSISAVLLPKKGTTVFQSNGLGATVVGPMLQEAVQDGIHRIGVVYTDDSSGEGQLAAAQAEAKVYGVTVVPQPMDPTATDVTPQLVKLQQANVQMIYTATLGTSTGVILSSYHTLNMTVPIAVGGGNISNDFLKSIPFALPSKLYGPSNLMLGPAYPTPGIRSAWAAFISSWKSAEPSYPMDQEVATTTYSWCLAAAVLKGTKASGGPAEAAYLSSHKFDCLGSQISYTNAQYNVPDGIPAGLVQAGTAAADGWGPVRTKL